ncbi:hypothetical protein HDV01_007451 [Terramyces sp. JEL0728]|nr:hypothetical protein HDV01_007451 [Terramyces sp. JEL0728]
MSVENKPRANSWKLLTDVNFAVLAISGLLFSYMGSRLVAVNKKNIALVEQIDRYKEVIHQYQEIISKESEPDDKHNPHTNYLKYLATDPKNPNVPFYPDVHYSYDDFETIFQVTPTHELILDEELEILLEDHNVFTDQHYLLNKNHIDEMMLNTESFFDIPDQEAYLRDHFYVKWASPETGFGLFAKRDIPAKQVIGMYAGELTAYSWNTDYEWEYQSKIMDDEPVRIGINGLKYGNYLRFVNHAEEYNTNVEYVPRNGLWHVLYVAGRDIGKDQELTTNYGDNYFSTRQ